LRGSPHLTLRVILKYGEDDQPVITNVQRVSSPAAGSTSAIAPIRPVLGGAGVNILSTPRGLMTGRQARKQGLGGEVLCEVW